VKGATSFTRRNLADSLRTSSAYQVNLLLGGYDDVDGPGLYYMDYLGACVSVPYAVHGYGSFFSLSVFDRHYKPDMTKDEAIHLLPMVIDEIATRFIVNLGQFKVKIIDKGGVEEHKADLGPTRPDPSAMTA
jgi:20S proteasome subunit beta 4